MVQRAEGQERLDDRVLLERLRTGGEDAFEAIFRAYYAPLVGVAADMLCDRDAAEEAVQDVMVELWRRRREIAIDSTLRAYLYRAVRNRALNRLRHERVVREAAARLEVESPAPAPADAEVAERELRTALAGALDEMPPRCREIFELSRVHGLRYSEIASALEISVKTVEVQMGKALRIVREHLAAWLPR